MRSWSKAGAAPATVIERDLRITAPLNCHCASHGKASAVRVDSPETGLADSTGVAEGSTVKRGRVRLRLFLPSSKALTF